MTLMVVLIIMVTTVTVMSFSPSRHHLRSSHKKYSHERRHSFLTRVASNATLPVSRVVSRESPVQPIRTIQEYETLVLDEKDKLVIIRFHAPWCKVCKTTSVAFERCATKIQRAHPQKTIFYSVNIDGSKETNEVRDLILKVHGLDVRGVPMGMLFHPREQGIVGKVRLNRKQLSVLKQKLEMYLQEEVDLISLFGDLEML